MRGAGEDGDSQLRFWIAHHKAVVQATSGYMVFVLGSKPNNFVDFSMAR
jgi:hypothetical protein